MANRDAADVPVNVAPAEYEAPQLTVVGQAADVVLGLPGGGFDGPNGMSIPQFEFEPDGEDS